MPGHEMSGYLVQGSATVLHAEQGVLVVLLEQRIGKAPESRRAPTSEERLAFGEKLIRIIAEAVLN
jgi:hypothetical protein